MQSTTSSSQSEATRPNVPLNKLNAQATQTFYATAATTARKISWGLTVSNQPVLMSHIMGQPIRRACFVKQRL